MGHRRMVVVAGWSRIASQRESSLVGVLVSSSLIRAYMQLVTILSRPNVAFVSSRHNDLRSGASSFDRLRRDAIASVGLRFSSKSPSKEIT